MGYLGELDKLRKKIWLKTIIIFLIASLLFWLPFLFSEIESISDVVKYSLFSGGIVVLNGYWILKSICEKEFENYKKIYAENITLEILKSVLKDVIYQPDDELLPEDFAKVLENSKIPTVNGYINNDYISAKYKDIRVEYCDISMGYRSHNDSFSTSFKGKWLVISFDKNFKANIQIGPKIFGSKKNGQMIKGKEYQKIKTEDLELNKKFIIYTDNQNEIFNILTPNVIDKIKNLYNKMNGKLLIFFIDNQIHIGLGDKQDFFEPNVYKKIDLEKEKNKILNQVKIITKLIDYWI